MMRFFILLFLLLAGCQQKENYDQLMTHPNVLKKAIIRCQSSNEAMSVRCEPVARAANDFAFLVNEQQENAEKFGQRIIDAEIACSSAKQISAEDWQSKCQMASTLLAVVSLNTPE